MLKISQLKLASTVSRVLFWMNSEYPCSVLSAYLYANPDTGELVSLEENKQQQEILKKEIRARGYGFFELRAKFKEKEILSEEESLCVPKMPIQEAVELGMKYKQFSILAKEDGVFGEVSTRTDPGEWLKLFTPKNTLISEKDFEGAFSQLKKGKQNARNKRIQLSYLAELTTTNIVPTKGYRRQAEFFVFKKEK